MEKSLPQPKHPPLPMCLTGLVCPPRCPHPVAASSPTPRVRWKPREDQGFIAQLRLKLFSDPTLFPTPALQMAYAFNRHEGHAQAQILPYIQAGATFSLSDVEDIIHVLKNAFGDPDPLATARSKLHQLKQGKKEFTNYFAEFQSLVSKLNWNEYTKTDALKEGLSIELRCQLIGKSRDLTYDQLVAPCQELVLHPKYYGFDIWIRTGQEGIGNSSHSLKTAYQDLTTDRVGAQLGSTDSAAPGNPWAKYRHQPGKRKRCRRGRQPWWSS